MTARVPYRRMAFTSELRGRLRGEVARAENLRARESDLAYLATLGTLPSNLGASSEIDSFPGLGAQSALLGTVELPLNPRVVDFDLPKRFSRKNVRDGAVFFHFTNKKGQNNDLLTLRFEGSTGNIDPRTPEGIERHKRWLNLYVMSREPIRLADGAENVIHCLYSSRAFPFPLQFAGFFKSVLKFTETGAKPNSLDYSFEFQVTDTDQLDEVLASFDDAVGTGGALFTAAGEGGGGQ